MQVSRCEWHISIVGEQLGSDLVPGASGNHRDRVNTLDWGRCVLAALDYGRLKVVLTCVYFGPIVFIIKGVLEASLKNDLSLFLRLEKD